MTNNKYYYDNVGYVENLNTNTMPDDFEEINRLISVGLATEKAYKDGYIVAQVEQVLDNSNPNLLRVICHHAFGTIDGLLKILTWEDNE